MIHFLAAALLDASIPSPRVASAYPGDETVHFDPFARIDWAKLAKRHGISDRPSPAELARLRSQADEFLNAEVAYESPLPASVAQGSYLLLGASGVQRLTPKTLRGVVRYGFTKEATEAPRVLHYGEVVAVPSGGNREGGFVVWLEDTQGAPPTRRIVAPQSLTVEIADDVWTYTYRRSTDSLPVETTVPNADHHPRVASAYEVRLSTDGPLFLFVRWQPDETCRFACCSHSYALFTVGSTFARIAMTAYDCDV
jgi:hypothetical protein